jgi:hypothetical protein
LTSAAACAATGRSAARGLSTNEFVEVALLATRRAVLHQQRQTTLFKFVEPIVPGNLFERIPATVPGKIDTDHTDVFGTTGATHAGRFSVSFFSPPPDFFPIGERTR